MQEENDKSWQNNESKANLRPGEEFFIWEDSKVEQEKRGLGKYEGEDIK